MIDIPVFWLIKQHVINILFSLLSNGIIFIEGIIYNKENFIKVKPYLKGKPTIKNAFKHLIPIKS